MKYLLSLIFKNKDYFIIIILSFFLSSPYVIDICSGYLKYSYLDLQEFLLWHYTSLNGVIPYKDIFYPYGLLNYFRNYNLIYSSAYYLISTLLFTITYFLFKKIFGDKFTLYCSVIIFYLFILIFTGFQTFSRYGPLIVFSLVFSYLFYSNRRSTNYFWVCSGIVLGLFISIVGDQGFYLIITFVFTFLLGKYIRSEKKSFSILVYLREISKGLAFVFLGLLIGIISVLVFYQGSFSIFFNFLRDVGEIVVVSKTPFFSFIDSPANIFTLFILCFAIFYNFLKLFFLKHKFTLSSFFQTTLIFTILIMEQKSIIRSIDRQITFVSLMLLMFIVYELINILIKSNRYKKAIYVALITLILILYGSRVERPATNYSYLLKNYKLLIENKCFDNNLKSFLANNPPYAKIVSRLKKQQDFNGKVFSFSTGDSVFYVLLNQKPPYYNAIFEGASYEKQNDSIKYIENNKIEYILLNTNMSSLQDAVPDYIRQSFLFGYILNNYQPFAIAGGHIILKKDQNNDFFISEIIRQVKQYENYLLNVYLYKIPFSEGSYKYNYLKNNNKLIVEGNTDKINFFLKENNFTSSNKMIVLISTINNKSQNLNSIIFQLEDGLSTRIYYSPCNKNKACIINLSRIPLFYKKRSVKKIIVNKEFYGKIKIFNLKDQGNLW